MFYFRTFSSALICRKSIERYRFQLYWTSSGQHHRSIYFFPAHQSVMSLRVRISVSRYFKTRHVDPSFKGKSLPCAIWHWAPEKEVVTITLRRSAVPPKLRSDTELIKHHNVRKNETSKRRSWNTNLWSTNETERFFRWRPARRRVIFVPETIKMSNNHTA